MVRFVLASASPARLATLVAAGVRPEVIVSNVDEESVTAPTPMELARELASRKAHAVASRLVGHALVLGCDSLLELDGKPLGKPRNADEARARWRQMRGRTGTLWTGHCLADLGGRVTLAGHGAVVHFGEMTDDDIELYCATGEPLNVAGAFTIDGLGGWFVERIEGDPSNVVGVSLPLLRRMLGQLGYGLRDIGYPKA